MDSCLEVAQAELVVIDVLEPPDQPLKLEQAPLCSIQTSLQTVANRLAHHARSHRSQMGPTEGAQRGPVGLTRAQRIGHMWL